jgi:hypothetical protein
MFVLMPIALIAGVIVAFWAGNGFKTLMYVRRYQPTVAGGVAGAAVMAMQNSEDGEGGGPLEAAGEKGGELDSEAGPVPEVGGLDLGDFGIST